MTILWGIKKKYQLVLSDAEHSSDICWKGGVHGGLKMIDRSIAIFSKLPVHMTKKVFEAFIDDEGNFPHMIEH